MVALWRHADAASAQRRAADSIGVDVRRMATALWLCAIVVLTLGILREIVMPIIGPDTPLQDLRQIGLDTEHSLPVWYESMAMALASLLLAVCARMSRRTDRENRLHWAALAVIFLLFSVDELVAVHEVTMAPLREAFGFGGLLYFSWVVIAAPLLVAAGMFFLPFLLRLPRRFMWSFCTAGAVFVCGAFGLEMVGGYFYESGGSGYLPYVLSAAAEECLEIIGVTLFVTELMRFIAGRAPLLSLRFDG